MNQKRVQMVEIYDSKILIVIEWWLSNSWKNARWYNFSTRQFSHVLASARSSRGCMWLSAQLHFSSPLFLAPDTYVSVAGLKMIDVGSKPAEESHTPVAWQTWTRRSSEHSMDQLMMHWVFWWSCWWLTDIRCKRLTWTHRSSVPSNQKTLPNMRLDKRKKYLSWSNW